MDTIFTLAALIGGTVLVFQFALMLLGFGDHHGDFTGADGGDFSAGADVGGADLGGADLGGDIGGGHIGGADIGGGDIGGADIGGADIGGGDVAGDHSVWHHAADTDVGRTAGHWFYEMLSLRTLTAAVTFFGLAGKTTMAYGYSPFGSLVLATLAGLAAMYIVYWLFKQVYKLQHSGTENVRNAIGRPATVYVPIPGKRAGVGKVMFRMQNRLVEYQAVTEDENRLATGEKVVVVAIVSSDTVRVARAEASVPDVVGTNTTA
jgi:hypothetical protein